MCASTGLKSGVHEAQKEVPILSRTHLPTYPHTIFTEGYPLLSKHSKRQKRNSNAGNRTPALSALRINDP